MRRIAVVYDDSGCWRTASQWACTCGGCSPAYIECVDDLLAALVDEAARRACVHRGPALDKGGDLRD